MPHLGTYKTPGVYVKELDAFPPSIVGVQTAVPAFIGYTGKADINGTSVLNKPVRINSLADYQAIFGLGADIKFTLSEVAAPTGNTPAKSADLTLGDKKYAVEIAQGNAQHQLYNCLRLFFANGGGPCFVVSVGGYSGTPKLSELQAGLAAIGNQVGPTMLIVPSATRLPNSDYKTLVRDMLHQCSELQDRVALLDIPGADQSVSGMSLDALINGENDDINKKGVRLLLPEEPELRKYGIVYFPFLVTSIVQADEFDLSDLDDGSKTTVATALKAEAKRLYGDADATATDTDPATIKAKAKAKLVNDEIAKLVAAPAAAGAAPAPAVDARSLSNNLIAALPALAQLYATMAKRLNVLPAAAAMAGVYTYVDATRGVWNAPANIGLNAVVGPVSKISDRDQEDLNVPVNGKAINVIREFVGRGTLVWGARTLDGNSPDWRYIQVRRTMIYAQQSIKAALQPYVFAANDAKTWTTVTAMISNFLQTLWSQGGLMGAKASEAFTVQCGLGTTMTGQDILDGYMIVAVTLQMIRPAEFIELTFKQQMQGVS